MWAILSGLEGNLAAYEAVRAAIQTQHSTVSDLYLLGDLIGLHPDSERLMERLRQPGDRQPQQHLCVGWWEEQCFAIYGLSANPEPTELLVQYGGDAVQQLQANVSRETAAWLRQQHFGFIELDCLLIHGSSVSVSEALTPETSPWLALDRLQRVGVNTLFCGRSGLTFEYTIQRGSALSSLESLDGCQVPQSVAVEQRRIVGIGSVGREPGRASYALYDPSCDRVSFYTVSYRA